MTKCCILTEQMQRLQDMLIPPLSFIRLLFSLYLLHKEQGANTVTAFHLLTDENNI